MKEVKIEITLSADGRVKIVGSANKILTYGMLELAKEAIAKGLNAPDIKVPDFMPPDFK